MNEIIKKLCLKYNCSYFNYFTDPVFETDDFVDVDHLNVKGSEKFSRLINDDILFKFENNKHK